MAVPTSRYTLASPTARLAALLAIFMALCVAYNIAAPIFEAPDERDHFSYASWLADGQGLPHMVEDRGLVGELWQPPLYYALIAAAVAPIDRSDLATVAPLSADWQAGMSRVAHYHSAAERFPYQGTTLAMHLARFISSLLGAVTIWCAYAIARHIIPGYALVAAALVAFNPQFIFISSAINNDNLVIALASVVLWLLVRSQAIHRRSAALPRALPQPLPRAGEKTLPQPLPRAGEKTLPQPLPQGGGTLSWAWYVLLGVLWGLAALAKLTGATLGLVIGVALLAQAWRGRSWRPVLGGVLAGATAALVGGWWFWRNYRLYGDPLAWQQMLDMTAPLLRPELLSWPQ
uniref:glycosyltransferase family 39 protein n=1 Tax=Promineifilum sp. TaxID=2664178 RepID=UPI0035B3F66D